MKRALATILAVFYLAFSIGTTVNLHYCMDEFVSLSLHGKKSDKCGKCGMDYHPENNGCCKDVQIVIESDEQYLPGQVPHEILASFDPIIPEANYTFNEGVTPQTTISTTSVAHSPPFKNLPSFIRCHSFLI